MYSPDNPSPFSDTSPSIESPEPRDNQKYVQRGPGSWQPLAIVFQRVISSLHVVDAGVPS